MGGWIETFTEPGETLKDPLAIILWVPLIVMGKIGDRERIAKENPPLLKGRRSPEGLRVPSGNTRTVAPDRTFSIARLMLE